MAQQPPPTFAWLILATSVLAVSSAGAVFQLISEVDPILRASWRLQATALILLPPFIYQVVNLRKNDAKTFSRIKERPVILAIIGSSICLWIHFGSWVWSLDHTSLTHSLLFVTAHPLVIVAGLYFLGKQISPKQTSGGFVGFLGAGFPLLGCLFSTSDAAAD